MSAVSNVIYIHSSDSSGNECSLAAVFASEFLYTITDELRSVSLKICIAIGF